MLNDLDRLLGNLPEQFNLDDYQVIFFPENLASENNSSKWYQSPEAVLFQKALRAEGIPCAGARETLLEGEYLDRRSSDIWLGACWILNTVAVPFFINVLAAMFLNRKPNHLEENRADENNVIHTTLYFRRKNLSKIEFQGDPKTLIKILTAIGGIDGEA